MKKKILSMLCVLLMMVTVFSACSKSNNNESGSEPVSNAEVSSPEAKGKKIGILVPATTEFFANVNNESKKAWEEAGYEVIVSSFDQDTSKQIEMIENYVNSGVDMICTNPGSNAGDDALKTAMSKGVKVFVYGVETSDYDLCAVEDESSVGKAIGTMGADYTNNKLGGKVQAIALINTAGQDLAKRSNGILEAFKEKCPNSEIVGTAECASTGEGTSAMENFLQRYPDVQVVLAYNDTFGLEAMEVLKAAGKDGEKYGVFGCDGTSEGLKNIKEGTIYRGTISFGDIGADVAKHGLDLMSGKYEGKTHEKVFLNNYPVTVDNIDQFYKD